MSDALLEYPKRRTFAIISHPDAGKTTLTEKLLLFGGAIQLAGTVKGRKATKHALSDWMKMEQERGISVTTSVIQFPYKGAVLNLLDTPGHEDFSEDTYRTLTAVDAALMVIDCVKGVESRTLKLMEVCRLRTTPVLTFINKLDREGRSPLDLLDEIETSLNLHCVPMTWPLGIGRDFKGVYDLQKDCYYLFTPGKGDVVQEAEVIPGTDAHILEERYPRLFKSFQEELELVKGAGTEFDRTAFLAGKQTPVYFGSALNNFGVQHILDALQSYGPAPFPRSTQTREVQPEESTFSGFVFKIQANMDPNHRDRIAFFRICSGVYNKGMKVWHTRLKREVSIQNAVTFMASEREQVQQAVAGDIIGIHNHGLLQIGDTFTQGEQLSFTGIPYFAPELFKAVRPKDPLKTKALMKGLTQLSEEGATQVFRPLLGNTMILGAVGVLQFDVVAFRLAEEYKAECVYDVISVVTARWVKSNNAKKLEEFKQKCQEYLAYDIADNLTYLAPSMVNLRLMQERWPELEFSDTREHCAEAG